LVSEVTGSNKLRHPADWLTSRLDKGGVLKAAEGSVLTS
jgi:hypothetical protein